MLNKTLLNSYSIFTENQTTNAGDLNKGHDYLNQGINTTTVLLLLVFEMKMTPNLSTAIENTRKTWNTDFIIV